MQYYEGNWINNVISGYVIFILGKMLLEKWQILLWKLVKFLNARKRNIKMV